MSPGKLVDEKDVGCQDKSGPGKIHEVILVCLVFMAKKGSLKAIRILHVSSLAPCHIIYL